MIKHVVRIGKCTYVGGHRQLNCRAVLFTIGRHVAHVPQPVAERRNKSFVTMDAATQPRSLSTLQPHRAARWRPFSPRGGKGQGRSRWRRWRRARPSRSLEESSTRWRTRLDPEPSLEGNQLKKGAFFSNQLNYQQTMLTLERTVGLD